MKPGFYVCEQAIEDECQMKEIKMYISVEIKYIKFILFCIEMLHYLQNTVQLVLSTAEGNIKFY